MNPCQSTVPMQTSQNNFQAYPQASSNQQSTQCSGCPGNPQGQCTQSPFGQFYQQQEGCFSQLRYPCATQLPVNPSNFYQGPFQNVPQPAAAPPPPPGATSCNASSPMQTQATNCGTLPQNIIDQIRACVANTAPIFILPAGYQQQPVVASQQATTMPVTSNPLTVPGYQPSPVQNYIPPPSFYPYPIPFPMFEPFGGRSKEQQKNCGCSSRSNVESMGLTRQCLPSSSFYNAYQQEEEHRCQETNDDTICSKRNCPSAISLQALASQLLSIQGIVSCTATRLILRKIPGSNITTSMEDTMERAQRSISVLNMDQLLAESRNAQQVNALINLHMAAKLPPNIIPILTLVQLKVNVLKAQVENLINRKLMENQGLEVEATDSIDPTILLAKTDPELREFLTVLKQKECDEAVNVNFAPYRSQRVIAENRLSNLRKKIRQVETEFERRRCCVAPSPPMSARIVKEFAETPCCFSSFGYPGLMSPTAPEKTASRESPDPFAIALRNPRKLRLKPHVGSPEATYDYSHKKQTNRASTCTERACQSEPTNNKERTDCPNPENCDCYEEESSSEESQDEDKKKLRLKVDAKGNVTVTSTARLKDVSLMKLASNVLLQTRKASDVGEKRKRTVKPACYEIDEEDFPGLALGTVPMLEEISEVARIDDFASLDSVPNAKMFEHSASEDESESFVKVPSTLEESKITDHDGTKDETIEKKVDETDGDLSELDDWEFVGDDIDYEKMKHKLVASSKLDFGESESSKDVDDKIEVTIPENRVEVGSGIKVEPLEAEEETTSGYYSRSQIESLTNDETSTSLREEGSTRKLEDEENPDETVENVKSVYITSSFLRIDNTKRPELTKEEEEKRRVEATCSKQFITTATLTVEPREIAAIKMEECNEQKDLGETSSAIQEDENVAARTIATLTIGGQRDENKKSKFSMNNDKIVSMLAEIKYDNPERIVEQFRNALTRNFQTNNGGDRCRKEEVKYAKSGGNCQVAFAFPENHFPWRTIDSGKHDNDMERSDVRRRDAFESTIRSPQETELNASNFHPGTKRVPFVTSDGDTSSYFFETGVGLLSDAFALMSNQIASFGSVVNKIAVFGNILPMFESPKTPDASLKDSSSNFQNRSYDSEEVWVDPYKEYVAVVEDVRKIENHRYRQPISSSSRRSIKKFDKEERNVVERDWLHSLRGKLKHSIIKDRDNGKSYVVMLDDSFRELDSRSFPRANLGRPYKIRRNLLIRSRLKEGHARKQNLPAPFTILKRTREMNGKSREISRVEEKQRYRVRKMKTEENFSSLPLIRGHNSKMSTKSSDLKMMRESNTKTTVTLLSTDSCTSSSESITSKVHDY
ncbi:hypothetical protein KPH14_007408 [Odynerus spinipes]|uniref:Uncharacterized protein n=1 Tax=Odynerus spinipes TaxID=1348599 RepID=A0AAD9RAF1_9HYME|nr:hypothetical protein KPH14_007408 [Odynerus spinipes]